MIEIRAPIVQAVRRLGRGVDEIGKVIQSRDVKGNAPVLAGTRVTTAAVFSFHKGGYSAKEIIREYPTLTAEDVQAAIQWEEEHSRKAVGHA